MEKKEDKYFFDYFFKDVKDRDLFLQALKDLLSNKLKVLVCSGEWSKTYALQLSLNYLFNDKLKDIRILEEIPESIEDNEKYICLGEDADHWLKTLDKKHSFKHFKLEFCMSNENRKKIMS